MFNRKEAFSLILAALVMGYIIAFKSLGWIAWLSMAGLALIILFVHHLGQKFTALFYDCSTEARLWTVRQFYLAKSSHFKFDFPMWVILPVFAVIFTFGKITWLALTTFEACPLPARVRRTYAELTEFDLAMIALGGLFFNAVLALISQALGYNDFAMLNLYFVLFNLIPISTLDGGKIFFGSVMLWVFSIVFGVVLLLLLGTVSMIGTVAAALILAIAAVVMYYVSMKT